MNRRYFITYNGSQRAVFPFGTDKLKYIWQREQDQIFKRKKLQGKLQFINNTVQSINDFDFFKDIERSGNSCNEIKLLIQKLCSPQQTTISEELITNGTFDTDLSGWNQSNFIWSNGTAHTPSGQGYIRQTMPLVPGLQYRVTYDVVDYVNGGVIAVVNDTPGTFRTANGTYEEDIIAGSGVGFAGLSFNCSLNGQRGIDNVSIREINVTDGWQDEWNGYFSTGAGKFNYDDCVFEVQAESDDKYRCIFDNWETEFNMFDYPLDIIEPLNQNTIYETLTGNTSENANCDNLVRCATSSSVDFAWFEPDYISADDMFAKGWCIKSHTKTNSTVYKTITIVYNRTTQTFPDFVIGETIRETANPANTAEICDIYNLFIGGGVFGCLCPVGDVCETFNLVIKNITGTINWYESLNAPIDNVPSGGTSVAEICSHGLQQYCSLTTIWESELIDLPCQGLACFNPSGYYLISSHCAVDGHCTFRRCPQTLVSETLRGVSYNTLVNDIASSLCIDLIQMSSIFFEYNPDTGDSHYNTGINYVTGLQNKVMHLMISQISDIIDPNASNPATIGNLTLKQLLQWAREVFNVYWDITTIAGNIVLRMEHYSFYSLSLAIDLNQAQYIPYLKRNNKYEHLKDSIPQLEKFRWSFAIQTDFIGKDIVYSSPCAKVGGQSADHAPEDLSTNVESIINNTGIDTDGFVMISVDLVDGVYNINYEVGLISGFTFANAHLSWANLHYNYHRWNRYLQSGEMNGASTTFLSWKPNIKQPDLSIPACCEDIDPEGYAITELGQKYLNAHAYIDRMIQEFTPNKLTFTLTYSI